MRQLDVLVSTHVNQVSESEIAFGPPVALIEFLRQRTKLETGAILHPFVWSYPNSSRIELFRGRESVHRWKLPRMRLPEPLSYLKDVIVNFWFVFRLSLRARLYVGADSANTLAGLFLKKIGRIVRVSYYSIDYTPARFKNRFLNAAYHTADRFCARHADSVWNLSTRMVAVRRAQGVKSERNLLVPVGTTSVPLPPDEEREPNSMAFVSRLEESKGPKLILDAMLIICGQIPNAKLMIIGEGPDETQIKQTIAANHLGSNIALLGPMDHARILSKLPHISIGLAPYPPIPNSITWYADPTKVKDYLSCGLPVILTAVPEVASEIRERNAGEVIPYSAQALAKAVIQLFSSNYPLSETRRNVLGLASDYSWNRIFLRAIQLSMRSPMPLSPPS